MPGKLKAGKSPQRRAGKVTKKNLEKMERKMKSNKKLRMQFSNPHEANESMFDGYKDSYYTFLFLFFETKKVFEGFFLLKFSFKNIF